MDKQHAARIRGNKFQLQKNLIVDELLLSHLHEKNVLSDGMVQDIEAKATRGAKASALLSLIPMRGPTAFKVFVGALRDTNQHYLAELLDPDQILASQKEKPPEKKIATSTEVSNDPEVQTASGGANKETASAPKKTEMTEKQSTVKPEKTEAVSYFDEEEGLSFVTLLPVKAPAKKLQAGAAKFIRNGLAFIINNKQLTENDSRDGAMWDLINFCEVLKQQGFTVHSQNDLTLQAMKDAMKSESTQCNDFDGLLLCIMGKGDCGRICGTDGLTISIDELKTIFDDANCPALKGKPRIFITETCEDGDKCPDQPQSPDVDDIATAIKDVHISSPQMDNTIEMQCTVKGYKTGRSEQYGSWFIRTLVKSINADSHQDDVVTLMKQVKHIWMNRNDKNMKITLSPSEPTNIYFHSSKKT